ncbi:MAG: NUDIX domain-containing protein [Nanoarchaeota archaeon]|nr:NUDIX domain-containing protein [Nanoarchaeota archaeon]
MSNIYPVVSEVIPYRGASNGEKSYVMVQEKDSGLWNQPGGGIDVSDKEWQSAAVREVHEESGLTIVLNGVIGNYSFPSKNGNRILCSTFSGEYVSGSLETKTEDIMDVKAMTLEEIRYLNSKDMLRSGRSNIKPIEDLLRRGTYEMGEIFQFLG